MKNLKEIADNSLIPLIVSETGRDDEPIQEVVVCESMSGGAQFANDMPKALTICRHLADGSEYRARYVQSGESE